jgi:hypothetical protein
MYSGVSSFKRGCCRFLLIVYKKMQAFTHVEFLGNVNYICGIRDS